MNKKTIALALLALTVVLAGCHKDVYVDAQGNRVEVDKQGGNVTVTTKDGTYTSTNDGKSIQARTADGKTMTMDVEASVSEADLGMPFYPGSAESGKGSKMEVNGKKSISSIRTTSDSPEKVIEFYKSRLANVQSTYAGGTMATLAAKDGDRLLTIQASSENGTTTIYASNSPGS